jgi:hypothetical protein
MFSGLRALSTSGSRSRGPAAVLEITNSSPANGDPLRLQERSLQPGLPAITTEPAGRGDHPVAGHITRAALAHDVADRARGAGSPGEIGHIAVGGDAACGDAADDGENTGGEIGHLVDRGFRLQAEGCVRCSNNSHILPAKGGSYKQDFFSKRDPYAGADVQPARIDFNRPIVDTEIDRRVRVANQRPRTEMAGEHPPHISAGIETGLRPRDLP